MKFKLDEEVKTPKKRGRKPKEQYNFEYFTVYKDFNEFKKYEGAYLISFIHDLTKGLSNIAILDSEVDLENDLQLSKIKDELIELENKKCNTIIIKDIAILQEMGKTLYFNTTKGIKYLNLDNKIDNLELLKFIANFYNNSKSVNIVTSNIERNISIVQIDGDDNHNLYLYNILWKQASYFDEAYVWKSFEKEEDGFGYDFIYNFNENIKKYDLHCQYLINRANNVELDLEASYRLSQSCFNEKGALYYYIENSSDKYSNEQKLHLLTINDMHLYFYPLKAFTIYETVAEFELK